MPILCKPLQPPVYFLLEGQLFFLPGNESMLLGIFCLFVCVSLLGWGSSVKYWLGLTHPVSDATINIFSKHLSDTLKTVFVMYADVLICQFSNSVYVTISSELLGTFLFLLTSLYTPMSQSLLSLVDFVCFQFSGNDPKDSLFYCSDGLQTCYIPNSIKFWGDFTLKTKGSNTKSKQIPWTNFPWSVCCANSNITFSNLGDKNVPGYQILLVHTNEWKPPPRSLVHTWRRLQGRIRTYRTFAGLLQIDRVNLSSRL